MTWEKLLLMMRVMVTKIMTQNASSAQACILQTSMVNSGLGVQCATDGPMKIVVQKILSLCAQCVKKNRKSNYIINMEKENREIAHTEDTELQILRKSESVASVLTSAEVIDCQTSGPSKMSICERKTAKRKTMILIWI
ncbi:unnamed protein product [Acanthoscelides obtectus]|uniref:Uncharacterized protein n=1 Tax=Acanthoscelides obtectus TaxID=200917 RepID=A0A9P0VPM7_ACAOB|nr:unnamed protein product [Acanthoscelides obtectus]CAK1684795.1 hypothetical protein AOBTE_LOCUS35128 [Acanthoscelides obtectus]